MWEEILVEEEYDGRGTTTTTTMITTSTFSPPPGGEHFRFSIFALCLLKDVEKETQTPSVVGKMLRSLDGGIVLIV